MITEIWDLKTGRALTIATLTIGINSLSRSISNTKALMSIAAVSEDGRYAAITNGIDPMDRIQSWPAPMQQWYARYLTATDDQVMLCDLKQGKVIANLPASNSISQSVLGGGIAAFTGDGKKLAIARPLPCRVPSGSSWTFSR